MLTMATPSSDELLDELLEAGEKMAKMIRVLAQSTPSQLSESMEMAETSAARWREAV